MAELGEAVQEVGEIHTTRRQEPGVFRPTAEMKRFAKTCLVSEKKKEEERASEAKIKPELVKVWRKRAGFEEWLKGEMERQLRLGAWEIWLEVRKLAAEGNLQAAKLFLEKFDSEPSKSSEAAMPETFRALAELARLAAEHCAETISC